MSELKLEFVGKKVKDMYGTYIGKVIGIITDIEGSIESVSVDCGSGGIKDLPYEQLLVQGDYVIFIPRWRLDAQKLLREKSLTLKRIKALQEIVSENDSMKEDAELGYLKYEKRLDKLGENTKEIIERLHQRISELDIESKRIKTVLFDAKLQYKSNEITDDIYQQINLHTSELIDHINLENSEIKNIINKLTQQTVDNSVAPSNNEIQENAINIHNEDKDTLENSQISQINQINEEGELGNNGGIDDNNQGLQREDEEGIKKELEDSVPDISNTNENENENERTEISQIITSAN